MTELTQKYMEYNQSVCEKCHINMYMENYLSDFGCNMYKFVCLCCYVVKNQIYTSNGTHILSNIENRTFQQMCNLGYIISTNDFNFDLNKCKTNIVDKEPFNYGNTLKNNTEHCESLFAKNNTDKHDKLIQKEVHINKRKEYQDDNSYESNISYNDSLFSLENIYSFGSKCKRISVVIKKNINTKTYSHDVSRDVSNDVSRDVSNDVSRDVFRDVKECIEYKNTKKWRCYACNETAIIGGFHCIACHVNFSNISYCNNSKCSRYNKRFKIQKK